MRTARGSAPRKVRQEGGIERVACALIAALLVGGCAGGSSSSKNGAPKKKAEEQKETEFKRVYTGAGNALQRSDKKDHAVLYRIWWEKAQLNYGQEGAFGGRMTGVRGEVYKDGKVTSTFTADGGIADKATSLLKLSGHVAVHSLDPNPSDAAEPKTPRKADMTCDNLEWNVEADLVKAIGKVTVTLDGGGELGPTDELWTNSKLTVVGTPDAYKPPTPEPKKP